MFDCIKLFPRKIVLKHFLSFEVVRTALAVNLLAGPSCIEGLPFLRTRFHFA
jgi:hypothetical protein